MRQIDRTRRMAQAMSARTSDSRAINALILQELEQHGPCTLETLTTTLPFCSWNQLFMAIDTLSREGALLLQLQARSQYLVSLASPRTAGDSPATPIGAAEATGSM